jgi:hypothetical protein
MTQNCRGGRNRGAILVVTTLLAPLQTAKADLATKYRAME